MCVRVCVHYYVFEKSIMLSHHCFYLHSYTKYYYIIVEEDTVDSTTYSAILDSTLADLAEDDNNVNKAHPV